MCSTSSSMVSGVGNVLGEYQTGMNAMDIIVIVIDFCIQHPLVCTTRSRGQS